MLTQDQIDQFHSDGVIVVPDVLPAPVLSAVKNEYRSLLDALDGDWHAKGLVPAPGEMDFWQKLLVSYDAGCDWFQPMDISLPGGEIAPDTPFHFGPAVFDMITAPRLLDMVDCLIGPEITSTPIQHVRLKPPERLLNPDEIRAHVGGTDWHQDRAVALEEADQTDMVTVWLAITDATVENGCLQVIPNKAEALLPHCPQRQTAIADGFIDKSAAVPLPVRAGGAVLFLSLIHI